MDLFQSVAYPSELWALFRFKFGGGKETIMPTLDYVSETQKRGHHFSLYPSYMRPTRQNTLFPLTRPGILEEGRSVGARGVATPTKA